MVEAITLERWQQAQIAERALHSLDEQTGIDHYRVSYGHNFRYLDIDPEFEQIGITEIGCADIPALNFCNTGFACIVVEPMPSDILKNICIRKGLTLFAQPFEEINIPENNSSEVWLFNVLQHVKDPERFIELCKRSKSIRYFEPIDTAITSYHPHSFTKDDFDRWFPGVNKYYNETTNANFHDGPCCYGVYKR